MNQTPLRARWCFFRAWLDAGPWLRAVPDEDRCVHGPERILSCTRHTDPAWTCAIGRDALEVL